MILQEMSNTSQPFFTIGVTTYNRRDMLAECLQSILAQTFIDYEVIIGNDYVADKLKLEEFDIEDDRFRIVNHDTNLGEINNMNWLLDNAKGEYFTWLADDDAYYIRFLESIYNGLSMNNNISCIYSGFNFSDKFIKSDFQDLANISLLTGKDLLFKYHNKDINLHGCYGVFETEYLKSIGGMSQTGTGISPYSSDIIVLNTALKDQVGYQDGSPVFYRKHEESLSIFSTDIVSYVTAQTDFIAYLDNVLIKIIANKKDKHTLICNIYRELISHFFALKLRSKGSAAIIKNYSSFTYWFILHKYLKHYNNSTNYVIGIYFVKRFLIYSLRSIGVLNVFIPLLRRKIVNL